jgi:Na+-transporting methylmalonyl-CoA/oxaloacetate decarboxylase gamma subunit
MTEQIDDTCIKFNKKSWHYRLVSYVFGKYWYSTQDYVHGKWVNKKFDTSLCTYFWTVVLCGLIFPFKAIWNNLPYAITDHEDICKAVLLWAIGSAGLHWFLMYQIPVRDITTDMWYLGFVIFFGGIGVALTVVGILALIFKLNDIVDQYVKKKAEEENTVKIPKASLLTEFLKAKKNKVCPCIKFVEEEENKIE